MPDTAQQRGGYAAPRLVRFGTFRDITRVGFSGLSDGFVLGADGAAGCEVGAERIAARCSR